MINQPETQKFSKLEVHYNTSFNYISVNCFTISIITSSHIHKGKWMYGVNNSINSTMEIWFFG